MMLKITWTEDQYLRGVQWFFLAVAGISLGDFVILWCLIEVCDPSYLVNTIVALMTSRVAWMSRQDILKFEKLRENFLASQSPTG